MCFFMGFDAQGLAYSDYMVGFRDCFLIPLLRRQTLRLKFAQRPYIPRPPNVALLRALWSLLVGIWDLLKGSWGMWCLGPKTLKYEPCQP